MNALDVLLVIRNDGALLPVYRGGLSQAEGWPWTIKTLYKGSLVLSQSGVMAMTDVDIVGPTGGSTLGKILSVLNSNWNIAVSLSDTEKKVEDIVDAVNKGLLANAAAHRTLFDLSAVELLTRVERAGSIAELFQALGVDRSGFIALDTL